MPNTIELSTELTRLGAARRIPSYRLIGGFGDSRIFLSWSGSGNNDFLKNYGIMFWTQAYSEGCCAAPVAYNGGVAGETTADMLARQPAYIASARAAGVNLVVVFASTNDRTGDKLDLGTSKRNLVEIVRNFQLVGIDVIVISETPCGNGASQYELTTSQAADHYAMHLWIERELSRMCAVVNAWDVWVDPASGTKYWPLAIMVRDGIHPSKIGAQVIGRLLARVVRSYCRGLPERLESNVLFNAITNIKGSLSPNPLVLGTGGSIASNCNATAGSVLADNWGAECNNMTGLTTTWSKEVIDSTTWQKVLIAGNAGASAPEITAFVDIPLSSLVNGDKVKATGLTISQGTGLAGVGLALLMVPSYTQKLDGEDSDNSLPWPSERLPPLSRESPVLAFQTSANHSLIRVRLIINAQANKAVNATVWFTKAGAIKVTY